MLILAGLVIIAGSVIAGYLLERGSLLVLMQPAELLIIAGGAAGIILVSSPARNLRVLWKAVTRLRSQWPYTQDSYLNVLKLLYVLFQVGRRAGPPALETHIESPSESEVFCDYPDILADTETTTFICDSIRIVISAGLTCDEIERMMLLDLDVQRSGRAQPLRTLGNVADSLPGLGIIAAVLGVVVTMQALGGPAADIGQKVAAALVGTFLGILLCYGFIGPIAHHLECLNKSRAEYLQVLRVSITAFFRGASPLVATEMGRRSIPLDLRPASELMEPELRRLKIPLTPEQLEALRVKGA